MWWKKK
jgi:hypothetical protein